MSFGSLSILETLISKISKKNDQIINLIKKKLKKTIIITHHHAKFSSKS